MGGCPNICDPSQSQKTQRACSLESGLHHERFALTTSFAFINSAYEGVRFRAVDAAGTIKGFGLCTTGAATRAVTAAALAVGNGFE